MRYHATAVYDVKNLASRNPRRHTCQGARKCVFQTAQRRKVTGEASTCQVATRFDGINHDLLIDFAVVAFRSGGGPSSLTSVANFCVGAPQGAPARKPPRDRPR